jgi:hypothetical protein
MVLESVSGMIYTEARLTLANYSHSELNGGPQTWYVPTLTSGAWQCELLWKRDLPGVIKDLKMGTS